MATTAAVESQRRESLWIASPIALDGGFAGLNIVYIIAVDRLATAPKGPKASCVGGAGLCIEQLATVANLNRAASAGVGVDCRPAAGRALAAAVLWSGEGLAPLLDTAAVEVAAQRRQTFQFGQRRTVQDGEAVDTPAGPSRLARGTAIQKRDGEGNAKQLHRHRAKTTHHLVTLARHPLARRLLSNVEAKRAENHSRGQGRQFVIEMLCQATGAAIDLLKPSGLLGRAE